MTTTKAAVPRSYAARGVDKRRVTVSLTPDERKRLGELMQKMNLSESAIVAKYYRLGLAAEAAAQAA